MSDELILNVLAAVSVAGFGAWVLYVTLPLVLWSLK